MDKYIGDIIDDERHDTRNRDTAAHSDTQFLRYNQYAQSRLFSLITLSYNYAFEEQIEVDIAFNQDTYEVDDNLAYGTRINGVEYSISGDAKDYRPLQVTPDRSRVIRSSSYPVYYRRRHGKVVIEPTPEQAQGKLRITYERSLDTLALRNGQVNGSAAAAVLNVDNITTEQEAKLVPGAYVCVSDRNGVVQLYNGVIQSYANPILTFENNVSTYLVDGFSESSMDNSYLTIGKYTTTHSKLANEAEPFFVEWVNRKLHNIDSSKQFDETDVILKEMKNAIVASYKMPDKARKIFPVDDMRMLIPNYD